MPGSIAPAVIRDSALRARAVRVALLTALIACCGPAAALASGLKVVDFHGYRVAVPRAWPVYDLAKDPGVCVRFNRHAVYLGMPGTEQICPAHAAGRTEALLLEPTSARTGGAAAAAATAGGRLALAKAPGGAAGLLLDGAHGVLVTATWRTAGGVIARALGMRRLGGLAPLATSVGGGGAAGRPRAARIASVPSTPGGIYTGLGFDACSTPSASHMAAWASSPYRGVGVYIGGANMACAQPNLTAGWVSEESAAGWHLIPIYVGLQAPSNSCGCAGISRASAANQGAAAAGDAVRRAQSLGVGAGSPIYFDMEAYSRGPGNSPAVLSFLAAWTAQLHAQGYASGVYSSGYSGIADLVSNYGTGYTEPDDIWIANWNGARTTSDGSVPSGEWAAHQRLHQYSGAHNETHGGVTINIDGDYLDAATAAAGSATGSAGEWSATSPPTISGHAVVGQTLVEGHGSWSGAATGYAYQWEDCGTAGNACVPIAGATGQSYTPAASDVGHTIRVQEIASNATATSVPTSSAPTGQVLSPTPFYWLYTTHGSVNPSLGTFWYGSPVAGHYRGGSITGMAATADGGGYWLVTSTGTVFAYGDAARLPDPRPGRAIRGIVAAPGGGYWLYTANGNVYGTAGSAWYGSPVAGRYRGGSITGMAATADGGGYWLVTSTGTVYPYGDAARLPAPRRGHRVVGIVG